ncbi:MAG: hypothetical protein H6901_02890 [Rhodobacteraceae bacterium]|nr:hypothetical protein [Paracoccaceae bacterium]MCP5341142.1 hypothetical protein [Paracoccaceae bacterium]
MDIIPTGGGRYAAITPLSPDDAFCMTVVNGRMVCVTTIEFYRAALASLLRDPPKVGTPYLLNYSGAEFVALFDKALFERLDAMYLAGATPDDLFAVIDRARAVLMALRSDDANRAFWPQVSALLDKLGVP